MPMHHPMGAMMSHGAGQQTSVPTEAGQAAFAAIQEIVGKLQADPGTDWSKVDIDALRQHLIDMDEVTMRATASKTPIEGGLRIAVTGSDRTLTAIRRMVPDHAREIDGMNGWIVRATELPNGVELIVTSSDSTESQKIRALGFMGIMTQGSHHQLHHFPLHEVLRRRESIVSSILMRQQENFTLQKSFSSCFVVSLTWFLTRFTLASSSQKL
jgi:hypothetical protein